MKRQLFPAIAAFSLVVGAASAEPTSNPPGSPSLQSPPILQRSLPESAAVLYNEGNAAYREGRYSEAVTAYLRALEAGAQNSAVYYNLGNAYFRLGRIGRAILNYERSLRLDPRNDDARQNLHFVSLLITDRVEAQDIEVRVQETIRQTLGQIGADWLAIALSIGFFGLCLVAAWWLLGGRRTGLTITAFVLAATLFLGSASVVGVQRWVSDAGRAAIVLTSQIEVRFEPSTTAKVAFVLHEGTKVWVERREENWALVHTANGLRGWLPEELIEVI